LGWAPQRAASNRCRRSVQDLDRSAGGLGIGLALVKGLVELHGGRIEARSEGPNRGSEFIVLLPLSVISCRSRLTTVPSTEARGVNHCRVLIADDNKDAVTSLAMLLEHAGHEVVTAATGLEALEVADRARPDVLILDIGMPGLNGYQVARRIRQEAWGRRAVLIAATGWGQADDVDRARTAGFDHHLTKPIDPDALDRLLAAAGTRKHSN
jgi:CheY-like chemotaxis protein